MRRRDGSRTWAAAAVALLACALSAGAQDSRQQTEAEREAAREHLRSLSIAELMEIKVITAGRKEEALNRTAAAVTVLRGEDLRRLGVRTIPDALRYVPGAHVQQQDGSTYAVSLRGFNGRFANKLQVLVDGRSVYTPLFSGVFWEQVDTLLEDVDRIEVIRGPGGSVWGANAVNGVINLITKPSAATTGALVTAGGGKEEKAFAEARWGGEAAEGLHYRAFAKGFSRDEQFEGHDDWSQGRVGMRADWTPNAEDRVALSAEVYDSKAHHERTAAYLTAPFSRTFTDRETFSGGHVATWWTRALDGGGELKVQVNFEQTQRERETSEQDLQVLESSVTHRFRLPEWNEVTWGVDYRGSWDEIGNTFQLSYDPAREHRDRVGLFIQDQIHAVKHVLSFIVGSRFEYNDHTGFEVQPTLRAEWQPLEGHAFWAAASRAVRTPSRADDDHRVNAAVFPGPTVLSVFGNRDVDSETLTAYEIGYRIQPADFLSIDLAAFQHRYESLVFGPAGGSFIEDEPAPQHGVIVIDTDNGTAGVTRGVEVEVRGAPLEGWRLRGTYAFFRGHFHREDDSIPNVDPEGFEGETPRHQATLWSSWDLPGDFELDAAARFTDRVAVPEIGSWTELDARIAWRGIPGLEVGVAGRSLLHDHHAESGSGTSGGVSTVEIERGVWVYLTWRR